MTVDTTAELPNTLPLVLAPAVESETVAPAATHWLPAVSVSREALDDPQGWYQKNLVAEKRSTPGTNVIQLAVENLSLSEREQTSAFTRHTLQAGVNRVRPMSLPADTYAWESPAWSAMVKADARVVTHAGVVYRVIQVGTVRVPVGGVCGVMTLSDWRGRGYARAALAGVTAFIGRQLWAPFALIICPKGEAGFYAHLGWSVADGAVRCAQPGGSVALRHEVAMFLPCQGEATWPSGPVDLLGLPW